MFNPDPYSPPSASTHSPQTPHFRWWPALVGGFVVMGASAFFGTVVTNVSVWILVLQGMSVQAANVQIGTRFTSPVALISLAALGLSGIFGGYVSASLGSGHHRAQGAAAGVVGSAFFIVMALSPVSQPGPAWIAPLSIAGTVIFGLIGGMLHARKVTSKI